MTEVIARFDKGLAVRRGPGLSHVRLRCVRPGDVVRVLANQGDWARVGEDQWIQARTRREAYLRRATKSEGSASPKKSIVKGDRVKVKQDHRWCNARVMSKTTYEFRVKLSTTGRVVWVGETEVRPVEMGHDDEKDNAPAVPMRPKVVRTVARYNDAAISDSIQLRARRKWRDRISDAQMETLRRHPNFPERQRKVKTNYTAKYETPTRHVHSNAGAFRKGQTVRVIQTLYDDDLQIKVGWTGEVVGIPNARGVGIKFKNDLGEPEALFVKSSDFGKLKLTTKAKGWFDY